MKNKKYLNIYHDNCTDGFTSSWIVWTYFVNQFKGNEIEFHAGVYNEPPPDVTGKIVYITDFSYDLETTLEMAKKAEQIIIIDHHESAIRKLENINIMALPNVKTVFDTTKSGARLTWEYFFPDDIPLDVLLRIEDRDIWKFIYPDTKEVTAALSSYEQTHENWNRLMYSDIHDLKEQGIAILRKQANDIRHLLKNVRKVIIDEHEVPCVNTPLHISEIGHILSKNEPFAASYFDLGGYRIFSLRSSKEGLNVAEIAEKYNGGGHEHASGFRVPLSDIAQFEIGNKEEYFNFDLDRMKKAVESETIRIPSGLTREQLLDFIIKTGKKND